MGQIKEIENFPTYFVTEDGSILRESKSGRLKKMNGYSHQEHSSGYLVYSLKHKTGKVFTRKGHRVVAEAFLPRIQNKNQIDHIDGDKHNNHISNLRWVNPMENIEHYHRKIGNIRKPLTSLLLTNRLLKELIEHGYNCAEIGKVFGVSRQRIFQRQIALKLKRPPILTFVDGWSGM